MILEFDRFVTFHVGTGFEEWGNFAGDGYLVYPHPVLREFGTLAQTITAFWHMRTCPSPTWNPAPLASVGCVPAKTLKRHLSDLEGLGIAEKGKSGNRTAYTLDKRILTPYRLIAEFAMPFTLIHRAWHYYWPDLGFTDLLLLSFYRFKCGASWEKQRTCCLSYAEIAVELGFSERTWRRSSQVLESRRLIERENRNGRSLAVSLPDRPICSGMNPGHTEPHPGQSEPVAA